MDRARYIATLENLRNQIRQDIPLAPALFPLQLEKMLAIIATLPAYRPQVPKVDSHIASLTESITHFYSSGSNRGWAQRFSLQDLQKLQDLWPVEDGGRN